MLKPSQIIKEFPLHIQGTCLTVLYPHNLDILISTSADTLSTCALHYRKTRERATEGHDDYHAMVTQKMHWSVNLLWKQVEGPKYFSASRESLIAIAIL